MANINITVDIDPDPFPFDVSPLAGGLLDVTAIPRARISYQVQNETITAKIATNSTSIFVECVLPANYAYVFEFATIQATFLTSTDDAGNFDANGVMQLRLGDGKGSRRAGLFSRGFTPYALGAGSQRIWHPENVFPSPLFNQDGNTPIINLEIFDVDADSTVEGDLAVLVSVLQFDLEQIFNVAVNFPLPVTVR